MVECWFRSKSSLKFLISVSRYSGFTELKGADYVLCLWSSPWRGGCGALLDGLAGSSSGRQRWRAFGLLSRACAAWRHADLHVGGRFVVGECRGGSGASADVGTGERKAG